MKSSGTTLRDVAEQAGVSIDTVSRVLNGKGKMKWASAMRRAREIREIAERLNYRPNAAARAIRSARTRTVGALVRNNPRDRHIHPVAFETILGINEGLQSVGYVLSVIRVDDVQFDTPGASRVFREHMLDGMIVIGGMTEEAVARLQDAMPNCIWADTNIWNDTLCIRRDELHVGETVGRRCVEAGYEKIVLLGGGRSSVPHYSIEDRYAGLQKVAAETGVPLERVSVPWAQTFDESFVPTNLLDPSVAFVTQGTPFALWLMQLAGKLGKVPGRDFGLACCDETSEVVRYWPGLSRMSFDHYDLGVRAARMMLKHLKDPETAVASEVFRGEWIGGCTTARPRPE